MVRLESEGARDVNPQGFCPRCPSRLPSGWAARVGPDWI